MRYFRTRLARTGAAFALLLALSAVSATAEARRPRKRGEKPGIIHLKPELIRGKVQAPRVIFILPRTDIGIDGWVSDRYFESRK